jgi:membrane protease YdiL (CAAX protease family)
MNRRTTLPIVIAVIPFAAVALGLFAAHSAWAAIFLYHAGILVVLFTGGRRRVILKVARGWCAVAAVAGAVTGACAGIAIYVLWPYIDATDGGLGFLLSQFGLAGRSWIVFAVYYATVHPLLEELLWRGNDLSTGPGPSWLDAAFAGYHMLVLQYFIGPFWIAVSFVVLFLVSWLWRILARRFGGIAVPLLSHAVADASIIIAANQIARGG